MAAATLTADKPQLRPDANGRFGKFGGKYVPETLIAALAELEQAYAEAQADPSFQVVTFGSASRPALGQCCTTSSEPSDCGPHGTVPPPQLHL